MLTKEMWYVNRHILGLRAFKDQICTFGKSVPLTQYNLMHHLKQKVY